MKSESLSLFARAMDGECIEIETLRNTKDGRLVDVSILAKPISTELEEAAIYVIYRDISSRLRKDRELRYIAYHDTLTGLPNRKSFYSCLEDLLHHAGRRDSDRVWALLFLDLDTFKQVNDTLGHDTGDQLLKGVAGRLKNCLRETDHLFRLSGDEFTIILTDLKRDIDVARVAKKILEVIRRPFQFSGQEIFTSTSIGISVYPSDGWDVEGLVKNADIAMYAAKEKGGDNYRFFTEEMNRKAQHRMKLENSLRQALDRNELRLYYQPLVNENNGIEGMEALLRWEHPELGLILPSEFIRITEETGIIVPVGKWVMETACTQTKRWHEMGFPELFVSVNLSARQLQEPDFEETVMHIIEKTGLPPSSLKLEVTEGSMIQNPEQSISKMKFLRSKGISFSIDDFGTGYSSLSYLKRFPIDALKIDRSFIIDSMRSKGDREIIKTILSMARNLKIDTIAEGVETTEQKEFLTNYGCNTMQGFLFAQPVPVESFKRLLEGQRRQGSRVKTIPTINLEK
jgi:diguanylate cyclase (GGDEF)-like protein